MTLDTPDFLLEDLVPEPRLELSLPQGRSGDAHCVLTTTKQDLCKADDERR